MADYSIQNAQDDLQGMIHGGSLAKIRNLNGIWRRAARNVIPRLDPQETTRTQQITVYPEVYDYALNADVKKFKDIRPVVLRNITDNFRQVFAEYFDLYKASNTFRMKWNEAVKSLQLAKLVNSKSVTLHNCDSLTDNGSWSAGAGASNLATSTQFKAQGSASVEFDVGATGGIIENADMNALDLTDHDEVGSIFMWLDIPSSFTLANLTSVGLRWGNSSSVYWEDTVTAPHFGSFKHGLNLLRFDWDGATETGAVDPAAIDYLRLQIITTAADANFRIDGFVARIGDIWEVEYYSNLLFRTAAGTFEEEPTDTDSLVNLDEDGYNIFLNEAGIAAAQQMQGEDAEADKKEFKEALFGSGNREGLYALYAANHPSDAIEPQETYYRIR
jgi:hypothetical protein